MTRFAYSVIPRETTCDLEAIAGASHGLQEEIALIKGVELASAWFERFLAA
jgi:hypothetical protein